MGGKYKLTYFEARGRAEIIRLILAAAGVEYEDVRIKREDWPKLKEETEFGALPIFECGDFTLSQTGAIATYIANKHGLGGKTLEDEARIDMIVDCFSDVLDKMIAVIYAKDARKEELRQKLEREELPGFLEKFENILAKNKGGHGYFVGDNLSRADLTFFSIIEWTEFEIVKVKSDLSKTPKLQELYNRVKSLPKISHWLETRPITNF